MAGLGTTGRVPAAGLGCPKAGRRAAAGALVAWAALGPPRGRAGGALLYPQRQAQAAHG
jgi:hypothetical protein